MAYMNQELKAQLSPNIKSVLKKYGMKGTISVRSNMVLVVNISQGKLDILGNWFETCKANSTGPVLGMPNTKPEIQYVNKYYIEHQYSGKVKEFLLELKAAMDKGNHDNSDILSDYFDVGWYIDIYVGKGDKPYVLTA